MQKVISILVAAMFAAATVNAFAADKEKAKKKPTAAECKKDPKMKGCEPAKK